jgi:hypothetical protein
MMTLLRASSPTCWLSAVFESTSHTELASIRGLNLAAGRTLTAEMTAVSEW